MTGARQSADAARAEVGDVLVEGRRRAGGDHSRPVGGPRTVLALQRSAGNAAVSALLAAKLRSPGEQAVTEIDGALTEFRRDEPAVDTVEKGLRAAKAVGVPVDLEGPKPPAAALAVTTTGFGPGSVAPKKPVPPAKPVPAVNPLGRATAAAAKAGPGRGAAPAKAPPATPGGGGAVPALGPAALAGDQLLAPPAPPVAVRPEEDPAFTRVTGDVRTFAAAKKAHPPAAAKAKEAQDAALPPTDDVAGQARAAKVDAMDAQQAGSFDRKAFIAAVKTAIEARSPKTLKEAADPSASRAGEVKGEVKGLVTQGKDGQAKDIEAATEAAPDESRAVPKPVTPMTGEQPGRAVAIPAAGAVPKPAPAEQVNLAAGKHEANQELASAEVTEAQLAQSNEPEFEQALADKQAAAAHADTAPGEFRRHEAEAIGQSRTQAAAQTTAAVTGMQGAKGAALAQLVADKGRAKSSDEAKRAEVTTKIQGIFAATEADVKKLLDGIDPKVEAAFEQGEAGARSAFETYVAAKMSAYKKDRYGGWLGGLRWAKDKLFGMPDKVNEFYVAGRELYLKQMDGVISRVADIVGQDLTAAKQRIARGRTEIAAYVQSLPADLRKVGSEASKEIGDRFQQLESDVDAKQESVVDTLATKYVEARKGLDERIEALQAENKGLVDTAIGAIKAVINTIRELVAMLTDVLSRAAGVIGEIIKNPVGFLGNLIAGVKGGILKFRDNIVGHLRKGLMGWLFGALAEGGVELPETFDVKGIIKLLASIFGLTWANIRSRIVARIGAKAMAAAEKGVEIFQVLSSQGVAGLWQLLVEKLGDIKEMILEQVKDFVITKIITAGITWLIGLLNPAAAFIKACKLIYDVVMFFVNNASRIATFVNTVIDSVADIARGNVSGVINKINDVLGQMVPLLIGFLASVIGLGGVGQKIRQIVDSLRKPVNKALDGVINTGLKLAGPVIRGVKGVGAKVKAKVLGGDDSPAGKQQRLDKGMVAALSALRRFAGRPVGERLLKPVLAGIRLRYGLTSLVPVRQGPVWAIHGVVNPERHDTSDAKVEEVDDEVLRKSVTAMRTHTDDAVKEAEKTAKRALAGKDPTGSEKKLQADLAALRARWTAAEPKYRALPRDASREALTELREEYLSIDKAIDAITVGLNAADTHLAGLNSARASVRRSWEMINREAKKGRTAAALATAESRDVADQVRTLGGDIAAAEESHQALDLGAPANVETLRATFEALRQRATVVLQTVEGVRDPEAAARELQRVAGIAEKAIADARAAAAALTPASGEADPAVRGLLQEAQALTTKVADLRAAPPRMGAIAELLAAAVKLGNSARQAGKLADVGAQIDRRIEAIQEVIRETTALGRPGATEGAGEEAGTTEAGARAEVRDAMPLKAREGHHLKIVDRMNNLVDAVLALKALEDGATSEQQTKIGNAVTAARARYDGLKKGLDAWNARASAPGGDKLWHPGGTSKVIPSWPRWKTPLPKEFPKG